MTENLSVLFAPLPYEEKINFFLKCQELLVANHPDSPFIFREDNLEERLYFFKDFAKKYKGFVYMCEDLCILFNKIHLRDANDPIKDIKAKMYQPPEENFNCYMIDWVVFKKLRNVKKFIENEYSPQIKWAAWAKNQDIKIYPLDKLLSSLNL